MNDDIRLLIMATLTSLFPVLGILGVTNFTADEQNVILLFVGNIVLLGARVFKKGQTAGPAIVAALAIMGVAGLLLSSSGTARAQTPENPSTIDLGVFTIVQDTNPENDLARFRFELFFEGEEIADFYLYDDDDREFTLMEPGVYTVRQRALDGYDGPVVACSGVNETDLANGARFELEAGSSFRCVFVNTPSVAPTATATATLTATPEPSSTPRPSPTPAIVQQVAPTAVPAIAPAVPTNQGVTPSLQGIRPPNTGSAGLLE